MLLPASGTLPKSTDGGATTKPVSLALKECSKVFVQRLDAAPEWNGKRGLVESYDDAILRNIGRGSCRVLMMGRPEPLALGRACFTLELELELEQEQEQREHEAAHHVRVEGNVAAARAARKSEPVQHLSRRCAYAASRLEQQHEWKSSFTTPGHRLTHPSGCTV